MAIDKITSSGVASNVNTIKQSDVWRLTSNKTADNTVISANLERSDDASSGLVGTGMTESSGIFSFPETGIYLVMFQGYFSINSVPDNVTVRTEVTIDNSSYDQVAICSGSQTYSAGDTGSFSQAMIDVTDVANVKVKFVCESFASSNLLYGQDDRNVTTFSFIRLGAT